MSVKKIIEKSAELIEQLQDIREAKNSFQEDNAAVFSKLSGFEASERALLDELNTLAAEMQYPGGVSKIPIADDFAFQRKANPSYAKVGILKYSRELVGAGMVKPPSANNAMKLIKNGVLPPEATEFLPSEEEKTYTSRLVTPKEW